MADATITYAVDNTADVDVVVQTCCNRVVVKQDSDTVSQPTANLIQKIPKGATNGAKIPIGNVAIYTPTTRRNSNQTPYFLPGDIAGTIRTASLSITVQQVESTQI